MNNEETEGQSIEGTMTRVTCNGSGNNILRGLTGTKCRVDN
jgi:hypothetical protein